MDTTVAKNTSNASRFIVRNARRDDMDDVLDMIKELAIFEKMPDGPKLSVEDLIRDGGYDSDTAHPLFVCFVAEEVIGADGAPKQPPRKPELLGYVMCTVGYATWVGKTLQMKDLFVRSEFRRWGVGRGLFQAVGRHAREKEMGRIEYHVVNWNTRAQEFYKSFGAEDATVADEWRLYRLML